VTFRELFNQGPNKAYLLGLVSSCLVYLFATAFRPLIIVPLALLYYWWNWKLEDEPHFWLLVAGFVVGMLFILSAFWPT
jgi:hypothetical protein